MQDGGFKTPTRRRRVVASVMVAVVAVSLWARLDEPVKETATMRNDDDSSRPRAGGRWATFRFSVVGPLLAAPPDKGELQKAIEALARKTWRHPVTGEPTRYGFATIERWYYRAKGERLDPVGALGRKVRADSGQQPAMLDDLRDKLRTQYKEHPSWSYQLHADNLAVVATDELKHERAPSYPTVRRFMKASGLLKRRRRGPRHSEGAKLAEQRFQSREVRSYEVGYVHGLWHADFHPGSHIEHALFRPVLLIDDAQEMASVVLTELRLLSSACLDSKMLLTVLLAGDGRLPERFRGEDLLALR
jgi:hypothetical protein